MSSLGNIAEMDKNDLSYVAGKSVQFMIDNEKDINRIASVFCMSDPASAFSLIMENGLNHMLTMCDLDDEITASEVSNLNCMTGDRNE